MDVFAGTRTYEWQDACLALPGLLDGTTHLVYTAPTSAGKTLVAEMVLVNRIISEPSRSVFLVMPYVAVCREKADRLDALLKPYGIPVRRAYGPRYRHIPLGIGGRGGLFVCTIEHACTIINKLLEVGASIDSLISTMVVDELHMIGDAHRGHLIETMLAKVMFKAPRVQRIGMSATLSNAGDMAQWLRAELFTTDFRPVPLRHYAKVGNFLKNPDGTVARILPPPLEADPDHIGYFVHEAMHQRTGTLIFCGTKRACVVEAKRLIRCIFASEVPNESVASFLQYGIAYHTSDLTKEEREQVETLFAQKRLAVLCATSTLAAGVNLPAQRVIVKHAYQGRSPLSPTIYHQMAGRAGRAGIDTHGESIVIDAKGHQLMGAEPLAVQSACDVPRALMEAAASGLVKTVDEMARFLGSMAAPRASQERQQEAVDLLVQLGFLVWDAGDSAYLATPLARAACAAGLSPNDAVALQNDVARIRQSLVLTTDLQLAYLCAAPEGIEVWTSMDRLITHNDERQARLSLTNTRRLAAAYVLLGIAGETSFEQLASTHRLTTAAVEAMQEAAAYRAASVSAFCDRMGFQNLASLVKMFRERLVLGAHADILDLVAIPGIKVKTARQLRAHGFDTPQDLACAELDVIRTALTTRRGALPSATSVASIRSSARAHLLSRAAELAGDLVLPPTPDDPLQPLLIDMTDRGVCINTDEARVQLEATRSTIATLERRAKAATNPTFNVWSHVDILRVLTHDRIPVTNTTKGSLLPYIDTHPLVGIVLECRRAKEVADALSSLLECAHGNRVHPTYRTDASSTGRIATVHPNVQCVPKSVRSLVVAEAGTVFLSADYKNIELRLMAHLSKDSALCAHLAADTDIFETLAAQWGCTRDRAKAATYGLCYGMGTRALAAKIGGSHADAECIYITMTRTWPALMSWMRSVVVECRRTGVVETIGGRKRALPDINSSQSARRAAAERAAVNTMCQGSAADIFKAALVALHARMPGCLVLIIHDEVILQVVHEKAREALDIMRECMESCWPELRVPLRVALKTGQTWDSLTDALL